MLRFRRSLACSFCRKKEAEVAKLVAGPRLCFWRVYICDACVSIAHRLMEDAEHQPPVRSGQHAGWFQGLLRRARLGSRRYGPSSRCAVTAD